MFRGLNVIVDLGSTPACPAEYNHRHSRCLEISNFPSAVTPEGLLAAIGHELNHPIYMRKLNNGNILLRFSSIKKAELAYGLLPRTYRGCQPHLIADPCSEPLEPFEALLPPIAPTSTGRSDSIKASLLDAATYGPHIANVSVEGDMSVRRTVSHASPTDSALFLVRD